MKTGQITEAIALLDDAAAQLRAALTDCLRRAKLLTNVTTENRA